MRLIIMPQALKISIPGIVNNFIGLFKDTTLVAIIGLLDPIGLTTAIRADSELERHHLGALRLRRADVLPLLLRHVAIFAVSGAQAPHRPPLRRHPMAEPHPVDASELEPVHTEKLKVSDELAIEIVGMNKWYGQFHVLRDIDLTVYKGERIVVCGPSGSGKSTLIRCINRLEEHQKGKIAVDGVELTSRPEEHRQGPLRGRDGVPALQPLPAPDHPGELHARADLGPQDPEEGGRGDRDALPAQGARSPSRRPSTPASSRAASSSAWPSPARSA